MSEQRWGQWKEEAILGPKGIDIVSLKKSVCFPDHLGCCVTLNKLERQKEKTGKSN